MSKVMPDFIIVGAQRSGTTFIHHSLMHHPDIFMPRQEMPFFEDPDYGQTDVGSFQRVFGLGHREARVGFKRPNYLALPECPKRIREHMPSAKLIAVLRDPVDRAISGYYHHALGGFGPIEDVNKGLPEILKGEYDRRYPRVRQVIDFGFYHRHLTHYLDCFDREQILVLLYDQVKLDPEGTLGKILGFLEVEESKTSDRVDARLQATVYSLSRLRFLTQRNRTSMSTALMG